MALGATDLTDLATLKLTLTIATGDSSKNTLLEDSIKGASRAIESHLGRKITKATGVIETLKGNDRRRIFLSRTPIIAVTTVEINESVIDAADFIVESLEGGVLARDALWPSLSIRRPGIVGGGLPGYEKENIKVTYDGGWVTKPDTGTATLPEDIERAAIILSTDFFRGRGREGRIVRESAGSENTTLSPDPGLPPLVLALLEQYTRLAIEAT